MGTIDLRELDGDQIVVHFGSNDPSINVYTLANSLVAFCDASTAIGLVLDPDRPIEITVEAIAGGSFRAVLKQRSKKLGDFFSRGVEPVLWSVVAGVILMQFQDPPVVVVQGDQVIVEYGERKIIIHKSAFEKIPDLEKNAKVRRNLQKTFKVLTNDKSIKNFGLTRGLKDKEPLFKIDRSEFHSRLALEKLSIPEQLATDNKRRRSQNARLVILKPWLRQGDNKWSFEWNGVPITAPIFDNEFFAKLTGREYLVGTGDALDVVIECEQTFDPAINNYVNDASTYEVVKVLRIIRPDGPQHELIEDLD